MNAGEQDERQLVESARADPARFLPLYDLHFRRVWAFVIVRCRDHAEAEDVTSEVFRKALAALPRYEDRGVPFLAWLFRIAANTIAHRRAKTARESGDTAPEPVASDGLERRALLFQLVDRLPEFQRQLIELRYVDGLSLAEAGHRIGKTEGAAKQLHRRALEQLREQMGPREEESDG